MAMALSNYPDSSDELWKECAKWLTRWEMIRPDHKANWENSTIADLATILRDGVLLCRLLNKIECGCIEMKDINLKPTMAQFLCLRNITLFLKTCETSFGLAPIDLFEECMLFDLTNFHKVLCTLSKLSVTEKALRSGILGFTARDQKSEEEEVIYQSLPKIQHTASRGLDLGNSIIDTDSGVREEIYQDLLVLCTVNEQTQPQEKRDYVIKELLDTEKNYVDVLQKLKENFMLPLKSLMKPDDHAIIFHKIEELYLLHSPFFIELNRIRTNPNKKISKIFQQFKEKFLIYGSYCANLTKATTLLQELCDQDDALNQAVIRFETEVNNGRFKLRDVLSVPMQRLLKYHLLLEKLVETTDEHHDEYSELKRAKESMLDVAGYINEAHRDVEHLNVINNLQENIIEWDHDPDVKLSNYGKLKIDAELRIKAHDDQKTRNRYAFIFDKAILVCKQLKNNQFGYRAILNIMEFHIEDNHNRPILNSQARWSYNFLLVKNAQQMAYTVFVRTIEMKEKIIKAVGDAHDNIRPQTLSHTNHNLEIHTFQDPVLCSYCCKYLKGLIFQGYLCQKCNCSVHKDCIRYSGRCGVPSLRLPPTTVNEIHETDPLRSKFWYAGEMERITAEEKLINRENGTFLVRISQGSATTTSCNSSSTTTQSTSNNTLLNGPKFPHPVYVISLQANGIKHMKINTKLDEPGGGKKFYLSQVRYFSSIEELIFYYDSNSLKENFARLDDNTKLLYPFHQLKAIVLKNHDAIERSQLNLKKGQKLSVISKDGYREGWWKGRTEDNLIGYFPVTIINLDGEVKFESSSPLL